MRILQFVSGHSSSQSIARYSSRPTALQLKGVSDHSKSPLLTMLRHYFKLISENQPQRTQIFTVTNALIIQNSNRMASRLTATAGFPTVFSQRLQFSRQRPSVSAQRAALMTKTYLTLPVCSAFAVSFHSTLSPRVPLICCYHILSPSMIY